MITETLMIFLTTVMSLNQPAQSETSALAGNTKEKEVKQINTETTPSLLRGGWDRN